MHKRHEATSLKMQEYRKRHGIKFETMARRCGTSGALLSHIENGDWITHPKIAARICAEYELDLDDYNAIVYENYRTNKLPKPKPKPGRLTYASQESTLRSSFEDIL